VPFLVCVWSQGRTVGIVTNEKLHRITTRQAKCESGAYKSVASFERDVEKQCSHFVRKHEVGRKLSKRMLKQVRIHFVVCMLWSLGGYLETFDARTRPHAPRCWPSSSAPI
jgi:hypothetical protein